MWLFAHEHEPNGSPGLPVYFRRHGELQFSKLCRHDTEELAVCVGAVSSWAGTPRVITVIDGAIFEFWLDGHNLRGPTLVSEEYTGLAAEQSSVAFQKEMDTQFGHIPETVTAAFRIDSGKVLTRVWTNATKEWRDGDAIFSPSERDLDESPSQVDVRELQYTSHSTPL
ncbi:uncharacterized protein BJX67DRAFT_77093 [Aspergillus lucknowensis]|uniref:Uncharacterized protein n=1 Tax=Aspergillus lucknowensis TaxID=176173 RepID=A0ABR4LT93_9EURO